MSKFKVKTQELKNAAAEEWNLQKELKNIYDDVERQRKGICFQSSAVSRIKQRLSSVSNEISGERSAMNNMRDILLDVAGLYERTEDKICEKIQNGKVTKESEYGHLKKIDVIDKIRNSDLSDSNPWKKAADKLKVYEDAHKKTWIKGYLEKGNYHDASNAEEGSKKKERFDEISSLDKVATVGSIGVSWSKKAWGSEDEIHRGMSTGSYNISASKGEAEASGYIGLYSYDENGKRRFTPGIGASVGIGYTALSGAVKGKIGNDYVDVHGDASVTIGKADAKADVNVGLFDKDGKLNPQINAGASAELLAAEASATVGVKLAGTDVDMKGSVNFGVGAHANVGLKDGRLSVDIGASLGIGVGVKLDIDMSGTVKAVADTVSSAWKKIFGRK